VVAPSSNKPPPSSSFPKQVTATHSRTIPAKTKIRKQSFTTTGISNDIFDTLLKEYTINQDNLKTCHSSIDSSSKSVISSLRQSIKLLSVQKRLHQKLLEFEIARLTPYWRSRADHIYKKLISRLPEDYQDTSSFDCPRDQNTLDRLSKLSNIERSNTELQQKITKAIDDFLDCFDSQDSLFQRYITQRTDCVTYLDSTGYFPSLFFSPSHKHRCRTNLLPRRPKIKTHARLHWVRLQQKRRLKSTPSFNTSAENSHPPSHPHSHDHPPPSFNTAALRRELNDIITRSAWEDKRRLQIERLLSSHSSPHIERAYVVNAITLDKLNDSANYATNHPTVSSSYEFQDHPDSIILDTSTDINSKHPNPQKNVQPSSSSNFIKDTKELFEWLHIHHPSVAKNF
jgi:hypothetical protein